MSGKLAGQSAIVTGAGGGIGEAIALAFAREGAAVVVADRDDELSRAVAARIINEGCRTLAFAADVTRFLY